MKKIENANVAARSLLKCKNHAYVTVSPTDFVPINNKDFTSLVIFSGHNHEVYGVFLSTDLIVNCGASSHFSPDKFNFINFKTIAPEPICAADGYTFSAIGCGNLIVTLPVKDGEQGPLITLKQVYYAPKMAFTRVNNLYHLDSSAIQGPELLKHYTNVASGPISINKLHCCMGHINFQTLQEMVCKGAIEGVYYFLLLVTMLTDFYHMYTRWANRYPISLGELLSNTLSNTVSNQ